MWNVAKLRSNLLSIFPNILAGDCCIASRWMGQTAQHSNRGRFSRAIRPEKTKDCACFDLKGKIVHGMDVTEALAQMVEHDHRFAHDETLLR